MTIKKLILSLSEEAASDNSNSGWIYKKSAQEFVFVVSSGLSIVVAPSWNFSFQGAMATAQPMVFVRSKIINKIEQLVLGKVGVGIVSFIFHQQVASEAGGQKSFLEFKVPQFEGRPDYSLCENIPDYLNELLKVSPDYLLQRFDMSSEEAFLRCLPSEFGFPSIFAGCGSRGWASFLLLRIILGDENATKSFKEKFAINFFPREEAIFNRIVDAQQTIPKL
jgi:hypothetical protein